MDGGAAYVTTSLERARDLLAWQPTVFIEEGIRRLMEQAGATARR